MRRVPIALVLLSAACARSTGSVNPSPGSDPVSATTLKDAFAGAFRIGAALNENQFTERDTIGAALVKRQFNTITPENVLKWEEVHPQPNTYNFAPVDRYVEFGERNGMFIVGHTLVWHSQTPRWVFQDANGAPITRDALIQRMHDHIATVVGRYKGRIKGWDVVNEAVEEDGTMRHSPWFNIIGEDFVALSQKFPAGPARAGVQEHDGFTKLSEDAFLKYFANGVDPTTAKVLYAVQWPTAASIFAGRTTAAAWRSKPSWYAVSKLDYTINPDLERFLAKRMNATTVELDAGHLSLVSQPDKVADLILAAAGQRE